MVLLKICAWFIRNFCNTCDIYKHDMYLFERYYRNHLPDREWIYVGNGKLWIRIIPEKKKKTTNDYPGSRYQNLFNYLRGELNYIALQSEMDEIIRIVKENHT